MILLIDNYDSFSYNLYQLIGTIRPDIKVIRNDELTIQEIVQLSPSHIIISPGPGRPSDAGICIELIKELYKKFPILGVCLGHQAICEALGAQVSYAKKLMHGKTSEIDIEQVGIFSGLPNSIIVARYHSLAVVEDTLPKDLEVIGTTKDGEIMAVKHRDYPVYGVQFHPESFLTQFGNEIINNFLGGK